MSAEAYLFMVLFGGMVLLINFIPAIVAANRKHQQLAPLFIINLFFGWTVLGWVLCFAWAFAAKPKEA